MAAAQTQTMADALCWKSTFTPSKPPIRKKSSRPSLVDPTGVDVIAAMGTKVETYYKDLTAAFRAADSDSSGGLTLDELETMLRRFALPAHLADGLLRMLDTNADGVVSFAEFSEALRPRARGFSAMLPEERVGKDRHLAPPGVAGGQILMNDNLVTPRPRATATPRLCESPALPCGGGQAATTSQLRDYRDAVSSSIYTKHSRLRDAFRQFDDNKDGRLSRAEMKRAVRNFNLPIPESHVDQLFTQLCDRNGDGQVDYEEFALALKRKDAIGN